jgi:hypothetical protein
MRGEGKVTLPQACSSVCHVTLHFSMNASSTSYFVLSAMDGKIEQWICVRFYVKLGKCPTENLEILNEAFGEHSLSQTVVFE